MTINFKSRFHTSKTEEDQKKLIQTLAYNEPNKTELMGHLWIPALPKPTSL